MAKRLTSFRVVEPGFPLKFVQCKDGCEFRYCSLVRHMVKHVLDINKERWSELLPEKQIENALVLVREILKDQPLDIIQPPQVYKSLYSRSVIQSLCDKYQNTVSQYMQQGCENCVNHVHYGEYNEHTISRYVLHYVLPEKKMVVIAKAPVKNGVVGSYSIVTAFISYEDSTAECPNNKQLRDIVERMDFKALRFKNFIIHDKKI